MNNNGNVVVDGNVVMAAVKKLEKDVVADFTAKCDSVKEGTKVKADEVKEGYVNRNEGNIDALHMDFNAVLVRMAEVTGLNSLANSVYKMMDAGLAGSTTGKKDLFKMVDKFKAIVEEEVVFLNSLGDEDSLKKAASLRAYTQDAQGTNIFEAFIGTVVWVGKRVARKLRQWFNIDKEDAVMNALCNKLSYIGGLLRKGGRLAFNALEFAMGVVVAGVIKAVEVITNFLINVFNQINGWTAAKLTKAQESIEADIVELQTELDALETEHDLHVASVTASDGTNEESEAADDEHNKMLIEQHDADMADLAMCKAALKDAYEQYYNADGYEQKVIRDRIIEIECNVAVLTELV